MKHKSLFTSLIYLYFNKERVKWNYLKIKHLDSKKEEKKLVSKIFIISTMIYSYSILNRFKKQKKKRKKVEELGKQTEERTARLNTEYQIWTEAYKLMPC